MQSDHRWHVLDGLGENEEDDADGQGGAEHDDIARNLHVLVEPFAQLRDLGLQIFQFGIFCHDFSLLLAGQDFNLYIDVSGEK